jgi:uncharacterized protein (TIGR03435 family)
MMRIAVATIVLAAGLVHAQAPQPATFEVASVKRNMSGDSTMRFQVPPNGTVAITNSPLRMLITVAYEIELLTDRFRLVDASNSVLLRGGSLSDELSAPRFDVQGKAPDGSQPGQQYAMLRTLLAERFKLRAHKEARPTPVYAMTVARPGRLGLPRRSFRLSRNASASSSNPGLRPTTYW